MNDSARKIAMLIIDSARENGYMDTGLDNIPDLADQEKEMFVAMLDATRRHAAEKNSDALSVEEISSMFAFVFAKAAEMVTNHVNCKPDKVTTEGLFDGKIPFFADDVLIGFCKKSLWPIQAGGAFLNCEDEVSGDPRLLLFEALKWTFRVAQHIVIGHLHKRGKI